MILIKKYKNEYLGYVYLGKTIIYAEIGSFNDVIESLKVKYVMSTRV